MTAKKKTEEEITVEPTVEELPQTRAQAKKALHEHNAEKRANDQKRLKGEYNNIKKSEALEDFLTKSRGMVTYHTKIAKDGRGFVIKKLPDGQETQQEVELTPQERVSHLDKAAGIEEVLDYLDRQLA